MSSPSPNRSEKCHLLALPREIRDKIGRYVQWGQRRNYWAARGFGAAYYNEFYTKLNIIRPRVEVLFERARLQERNSSQSLFHPDDQDVLILARTCRQLYAESSEIFYGETILLFRDTWGLYCYLYMIGPKKRSCIRQLRFYFAGTHTVAAFQLLGECKALKSLKIGVVEQTMLGSKQPKKDLMTARGVCALRRIRGMENLVVDVVETAEKPRWNGWELTPVSISRPEAQPYFEPEHIQACARLLTEEMRREAEASHMVQGELSEGKQQLKPRSRNPRPKVSKSRTLRSGRVQKSRLLPTRKVAGKAKVDGKRK